ncbi:hypothetical protein [Streptomyces spiramyceticus]|uniref:hypothetical protein n=1 Tax=Streptomyces spiramyceticus TaxID=299717 RepID=UPI00237B3979|nr:hypothetical protein [Streptomyces spiramyceticus]
MSQLPKLRRRRGGRVILDGSEQVYPILRALADLYYEDPEGIGDVLVAIADLDKAAECERDLDGLGSSEHARDDLVNQLLDELGGAELHFDHRANHYAVMQARRVAHEAQHLATQLTSRAAEVTRLAAIARGERERENGRILP